LTDLSIPAGVLIKTTLVDFPGRVAAAYFLSGCNLRCPYCYNKELVTGTDNPQHSDFVSPEKVLAHLQKRANVLTGFAISGGEPTLHPLTPLLIKKARALGYKIKLDTNGLRPDILKSFISDPELRPDFIAMDIKTSPGRYESVLHPQGNTSTSCANLLQKSAALVASYPAGQREFRTVLVPELVTDRDIPAMAALLPQDASWQFAQFRNENCIDKTYTALTPYTDAQIQELVTQAQSLIPHAALR